MECERKRPERSGPKSRSGERESEKASGARGAAEWEADITEISFDVKQPAQLCHAHVLVS